MRDGNSIHAKQHEPSVFVREVLEVVCTVTVNDARTFTMKSRSASCVSEDRNGNRTGSVFTADTNCSVVG